MGSHEHISKQFDADLEAVRTRVLHMGGFVEEQIEKAIEALITGNESLIENIIADDHRVNAMEVSIDEICNQIIARRQPAAGSSKCRRRPCGPSSGPLATARRPARRSPAPCQVR